MVISKRDCIRCKLYIWDVKIKQIQKFNNFDSVLTEDRMYDRNQKAIGIVKEAIQKINKVQRDRKMSLETKKMSVELNLW